MWRYWVGGAAALVLALAGTFLFRGSAAPDARASPLAAASPVAAAAAPLPDEAPSADARTREQKRFDRIDKDRDQIITRDEFFAMRKKAFAKLDVNHDGRLDFDEWAVRGITRYTGADQDRSGTLNRAEFATTAVKRKAPARPKCDCRPQPRETPAPEGADEEQ